MPFSLTYLNHNQKENQIIMKKENDDSITNESENVEVQEQALAVVAPGQQLAAVQGFDGASDAILAELNADIESTLKQIAVTEFKGAKAFLNQDLALLDAFPFVMQEDSKQIPGTVVDVNKVMFVVADVDGEIHHVMQNANPGRERFITLYAKIKAANAASGQNKQLTLTHVSFVEMGKERFGNRPIILSFTPETAQAWS